MLRTEQGFSVFSRSARLSLFAVVGLCLLMADEGVAQNRTVSHLSRPTRSGRECRECVVDRAYGAIAPPYRYYPPQWKRWPSFSPHTTTSPAGQGRPFETKGIDLPESTREDKTLPPKRDTIGDTSNDPLIGRDNGIDKPGQLFPDVSPNPILPDSPPTAPIDPPPKAINPFEDDEPGIDPIPGLPNDKPLPLDGGATSVRLPRNVVSQVPQTSVVPRESFQTPAENTAQVAAQLTDSSIARALDDSAPRPADVSLERPDAKLLAPSAPAPVAVAPAKLRPLQNAEPISVQSEAPRKAATGPTNPLRLRRTNGPASTSGPRLRQSNHQQDIHQQGIQRQGIQRQGIQRQGIHRQTAPRRRNPLR